MSSLSWACVGFGLLVAAVILAVILWDINAVDTGRMTVSAWCLEQGKQRPWVVALLTALATLPLGILIGHLWFPQER